MVLYFYPRDESPGCTKEACGFRDLKRKLEKLDVAVLGISPDDVQTHARFAKKNKLKFPVLSDPDRLVMTEYGAFGEKLMYGKATVGVIRCTYWIDGEGVVVKHWKRIAKAAEHPRIVVDALQASEG